MRKMVYKFLQNWKRKHHKSILSHDTRFNLSIAIFAHFSRHTFKLNAINSITVNTTVRILYLFIQQKKWSSARAVIWRCDDRRWFLMKFIYIFFLTTICASPCVCLPVYHICTVIKNLRPFCIAFSAVCSIHSRHKHSDRMTSINLFFGFFFVFIGATHTVYLSKMSMFIATSAVEIVATPFIRNIRTSWIRCSFGDEVKIVSILRAMQLRKTSWLIRAQSHESRRTPWQRWTRTNRGISHTPHLWCIRIGRSVDKKSEIIFNEIFSFSSFLCRMPKTRISFTLVR